MATKKNRKCIFKIGPKQCPLELPPLDPYDPSTQTNSDRKYRAFVIGHSLQLIGVGVGFVGGVSAACAPDSIMSSGGSAAR